MITDKVLTIDAIHVSSLPVRYTCYGLGSCIGLFITDREKSLSAGGHLAFPHSSNGSFTAAAILIEEMLHNMQQMGSDLSRLRAKLAGGANMFQGTLDIGKQNAHAVMRFLTIHKIYLASSDLGGRSPRTVRFNSQTNELQISTSSTQYSI